MKYLILLGPVLLGLVAGCAFAQDDKAAAARQEEQRSCSPCHSLRLVDSQRLSQAAWDKELTKMIGWGAVVSNRQLLLDYLSQQYGVCVPRTADPLSANGAKSHGSGR